MPAVIQHLSMFPTAYYCGGAKGWLTDPLQAVHYNTLAAAQTVIDGHRMYAIGKALPLSTTVVQDFTSLTTHIVSIFPESLAVDTNGNAKNFEGDSGLGLCCAVLSAVNVSGTLPTADVFIEESDDGVTWTPILGAVFTQLGTAPGDETITFNRVKDRLRAVVNLGGTLPVYNISVLIYQSTM